MGFLRLITGMGMNDSLLPLIIPSIASPSVFYFMYSYLQIAAELPETIRLLMIPRTIGKVPSFATF